MIHDGDDLLKHVGHKIVTVKYGHDGEDGGELYAVAVECETCNEILLEYTFWEENEVDESTPLNEEVACVCCRWEGNARECVPLSRIPYLGLRIKPGEGVPFGACPNCGELIRPVWKTP